MGALTFFWHDYETFGSVPRRDRPAQFAGLRTNAELEVVDAPVTFYCRPAPDFLPEPEACLLTGILPQQCLAQGLPEHEFAARIERELATPGTVGAGYNSIRFDDEVTRFLFWRCLIDPYAREWQNDCGRWDLLDPLRCAYALRPEGIEWPRRDDGRTSFKLEHLTRANGLAHDSAHDALSDVRATLALARLLKSRQPRLWEFCLRLRSKQAVLDEIAAAQSQGRPFLHVSGMYGVERGCLALVWPLAPHPTNRNEIIVWDLAQDPAELQALDVDRLRQRMFTRSDELPEGVARLPIKTIHVNKSPIVISHLHTLRPALAQAWGIDMAQALRHAERAARDAALLAGLWPEVFERPPPARRPDVDEDLYGAFVGNEDRRTLQRLRALSPQALAARRPDFADPRLDELLFRYRARNFPDTLSPPERQQWEAHRSDRLCAGEMSGRLGLKAFAERIAALQATADAHGLELLAGLRDYAARIAPDCQEPTAERGGRGNG
jgi:exodeoxyribonuclease-1